MDWGCCAWVMGGEVIHLWISRAADERSAIDAGLHHWAAARATSRAPLLAALAWRGSLAVRCFTFGGVTGLATGCGGVRPTYAALG